VTTPTPAEGRVEIRLDLGGRGVSGAEVVSRRPQPGRLLAGRSPEHTVTVIPRLYSLCGDAQTVAAEALRMLLERGGIDPGARRAWAERIRLENLREHLWRLGLDWMAVAGAAPRPEPLRVLLAEGKRFVQDAGAARAWARDTSRMLFGDRALPWLGDGDPAVPAPWLRQDPAPLAQLLGTMRPRLQGTGRSDTRLFRSSDVDALAQAALPRLRGDPDYHWQPDWQGQLFEMGPLARMQQQPLIQALLQEAGAADAWVRLVSRVLELARGLQSLAEGEPAEAGLAGQAADGEAVVALEMARGVLMHWARAEQGSIADYRIVAPTEWNFHPRGAAWRGLLGVRADDENGLREQVRLQVMALDPCVSYELEIRRA